MSGHCLDVEAGCAELPERCTCTCLGCRAENMREESVDDPGSNPDVDSDPDFDSNPDFDNDPDDGGG